MEMADDEARNKWLLPQIVIGFVLVLLLCQQVFEIIGTHDQFNKGIAATKRGDDSEASVDFSVVLTRQPDNVQAYLYRALCETKLGQSKKALDDYAKVILMQPKNVLGYAGRASLNIKSKKYDEAIMDCDTMAGLQPNYPDALRLRAVAQSKSKRYKEAIEDATRYLTTFSDKDTGAARADVLRTRGYCYYKLKNFDQAAQDYSDAIAADPSNGGTYASRAIVYRELHDWNRALQDANKAATLDPNDTSIFQLRGMCYREQGDSAKALAELDRAVKLTPKVSLFRMRGQARLAVRDFEGAIKDLDYVLSITPDDKEARAWYERARLNLRSNTKSTTSVVADVSSKSDTVVDLKGSPIQLMNRGYLLLKKGDSTEAVELLTAAVRNDPTNAQARRYLAYALDADGDDAAAAKQFSMLQGLGGLQAADQAAYQKILARLKLQADTTKAAPASKTSKP